MNRLRHMAVFAHIVKTGSITKAAERLALSKSVVSQHLKALEQELGVSLLKRTTRRQTLTAVGQQFFAQCEAMNVLVDDAWQQAMQTKLVPTGKVRITAPHALMGPLIAPAVAQVMAEYPAVSVELLSSDTKLDIAQGDFDLVIRVGDSPASSVKQKRIGAFRDVLCAAGIWLNRTQVSQIPYVANHWQGSEIEHHFCHIETGEVFTLNAQVRCKADAFHTCLALIESGVGMGLIPDFALCNTGASISRVLPEYQLPLNSVYALHPYDNLRPLSVTVCLEAIAEHLKVV